MANLVYTEGTLIRDPYFKYTPKGTAVCTFTVLDIYRYRGSGGAVEKKNNFDIETWGQLAEKCNSLLNKGFGVEIKGRLKQDRWTDLDKKQRSRIIIVANSVELASKDCIEIDEEDDIDE